MSEVLYLYLNTCLCFVPFAIYYTVVCLYRSLFFTQAHIRKYSGPVTHFESQGVKFFRKQTVERNLVD